MLADALQPYGGRVIWRCFVYNCKQDWRDRKTDRARAAFDHFKPLDGLFRENVILQIKNGPMDFQVREPVSPCSVRWNPLRYCWSFKLRKSTPGNRNIYVTLFPNGRKYWILTHTPKEKAPPSSVS